jgi:DNA polymerase-3 subunit gamma/tau
MRLAQTLPADETQLLYSLCLHGRGELGLAPDEYAALTMVLLRLLAFKPSAAAPGTLAEKKTLNFPAQPPAAPAASQPAAAQAQRPAAAAPAPIEPTVAPKTAAVPVQPVTAEPVVKAFVPPSTPTQDRATPPLAAPQVPEDEGPPWEESVQTSRRVVAIPVRDAGEPGRLDQPRVRDAAEPTALQAAPVTTAEGDFWFDAIMQLVRAETIGALVRELALQSQLVARDAGQWVLRVERETLNQANARERLSVALQTIGHEVRLAVEIGTVTDSPALRVAAEAARRQREAEAHILGDPFVQTMMRDFGGKIVPGSIKPLAA